LLHKKIPNKYELEIYHNPIQRKNKSLIQNFNNNRQFSIDYKRSFNEKLKNLQKNQFYYNLQNRFAMNYFFKEFSTNKNIIIHNLKSFSNYNNKNNINDIDNTHMGLNFSGKKFN